MVRFYKKVMHFLTLVKEVYNRNFSVTFFCLTFIRFFIYYIFSSFISFFLSCVLSFSLYFLFSSVFLFFLILCYILPFLLLWFLSIFLFFFPFRCWMKYKNMGKCFEDTYTQTREPLTMTTFALSSFYMHVAHDCSLGTPRHTLHSLSILTPSFYVKESDI